MSKSQQRRLSVQLKHLTDAESAALDSGDAATLAIALDKANKRIDTLLKSNRKLRLFRERVMALPRCRMVRDCDLGDGEKGWEAIMAVRAADIDEALKEVWSE